MVCHILGQTCVYSAIKSFKDWHDSDIRRKTGNRFVSAISFWISYTAIILPQSNLILSVDVVQYGAYTKASKETDSQM